MDADQIQNLFAGSVRRLLMDADLDYDKLYEIRLRVGRPLFLTYDGGECFLRQKGEEPYLVTREDLKETLEYISGYSLYAYEDEIRQGFLSVQGGHRVGVTGKVILDGNHIRGMKYISCINVRLSHEITGCADEVMPYIQNREQIMHTLIVSPPRCGKTTLLRDIIRQLSSGWGGMSGVTVGVVDERSELAGCYQGIPQNDLGMRTDILDGCPKAEGMQMLIRSMSPVVVAVDELGKEEDFKAVESVIHCGCRLIATAHGESLKETLMQPFFKKLWEARVFQRYIFLGRRERAGIVEGIFDENGNNLCIERQDWSL
nr:stage III sporulation protein AA [uncultured Blautia sp.]